MTRFFLAAEQQADAPQASQAHQGENDAGEDGQLTAAEECHQVEAEQADAAPVQGADDDQDQCDLVKDHG